MPTDDPVEHYVQLVEILAQLRYLGEHYIARAVEGRLEDLYAEMDAQDHKELAIAIENMGG